MATFKVGGNAVVRIDASAGGALTAITTYVQTMSAFGKEVEGLDSTHFDDEAERVIAGLELAQEVTISGLFDDTATTGPDAIFSTAVGTALTFEYNPVGTASGARKITAEMFVMAYNPQGEVKGAVMWEATLKKDGTVTFAAN